jgi:hypothetical protein
VRRAFKRCWPHVKLLTYMGITKVINFSKRGGSDPAVLFECWTHSTVTNRVSKGFGCLAAPPGNVHANLNTEPDDCVTGEPAFALVEDGVYLYYLREDALPTGPPPPGGSAYRDVDR